jgi:hypothetical protein
MQNNIQAIINLIRFALVVCILALFALLFGEEIQQWFGSETREVAEPIITPAADAVAEQVRDGIHIETGLIFAEGFETVRANCTGCHSAKLITQNRSSREGWAEMINWMQATQGLWELGDNKPVILDYLAEHYAPKPMGRRANLPLESIEWYILDLEE